MKSILKLTVLSFVLSLLIQPVQGQNLLKKIKEKAETKIEEKINERVEKKVDEKIDEGLDKVEESLEKENGNDTGDTEPVKNTSREQALQNRMQGMLKGMGISGEPVLYENNYSFDYLIQMHIQSYDNTGASTSNGEFITHLNPNSKSLAYEVVSGDMAKPGQGMFILDAENGAMIILNNENGEKTGIVYGMGAFFQSVGESYEEDIDLSETPETYLANPNVKKTGKTKTIAGYKCEEYVYEDEETKSHIWITKDMKMNTQDFFSTLFKTSLYSHGMGWGYMMEANSENKNTGEKSVMQVTRVDKNSNKKFDLGSYNMTNLGSFTLPAGEE